MNSGNEIKQTGGNRGHHSHSHLLLLLLLPRTSWAMVLATVHPCWVFVGLVCCLPWSTRPQNLHSTHISWLIKSKSAKKNLKTSKNKYNSRNKGINRTIKHTNLLKLLPNWCIWAQMTKLGYLLWFLVKEERKQRKDRFKVEFEIIQEGATQNQSLGKFLFSFQDIEMNHHLEEFGKLEHHLSFPTLKI